MAVLRCSRAKNQMSLKYESVDELPPTPGPESENQAIERVREPLPVYTVIMVAAILVVAAVQIGTGLDASILAAGFVKPAFLRNHEYWRMLTGAATHGSLAHVAMNSFAFYSF